MSAKREVVSPPMRALEASANAAASMAVRGGDFIFVSGLAAVDPRSGEHMCGTTASETRHILSNFGSCWKRRAHRWRMS